MGMYDWAKDRILKYLIALIFLVDFFLTWRRVRKALRGADIVGGTYNRPTNLFLVKVGLSILGSILWKVMRR